MKSMTLQHNNDSDRRTRMLMIVIGTLLILAGLYMWHIEMRFQGWVDTSAQVTTNLHYKYTANGKVYEKWPLPDKGVSARDYTESHSYHLDDAFPIRYNPRNPSEVTTGTSASKWIPFVILLPLGAAFILGSRLKMR